MRDSRWVASLVQPRRSTFWLLSLQGRHRGSALARGAEPAPGAGLTIHSSRRHFVARLNSGVRPLKSKAAWSHFKLGVAGIACYLKLRSVRSRAVEFVTGRPGLGQAKRPIGRAALDEGAASAGSRPETHVAARPDCPASEASQAETLRASHCRRMLRPNQSFKPMPLRDTA